MKSCLLPHAHCHRLLAAERVTKEAVALQLWGRHALWAALASCQHTICITDKVQKGVGKICLSLKITSEWEGATSHPNYNFSHSVFKPVGFITHGFRYQAIGYPSPPQLAPSPKRGKSRFRRFISPHNRLGERSTLWHSLLSTGIIALQAPLGMKQEGVDWDSDTAPAQGEEQQGLTYTETHLGHPKLAFCLKKATLRSCCSYLDLGESDWGHIEIQAKAYPSCSRFSVTQQCTGLELATQVAAEPGVGRGWCKGALVGSQ